MGRYLVVLGCARSGGSIVVNDNSTERNGDGEARTHTRNDNNRISKPNFFFFFGIRNMSLIYERSKELQERPVYEISKDLFGFSHPSQYISSPIFTYFRSLEKVV